MRKYECLITEIMEILISNEDGLNKNQSSEIYDKLLLAKRDIEDMINTIATSLCTDKKNQCYTKGFDAKEFNDID